MKAKSKSHIIENPSLEFFGLIDKNEVVSSCELTNKNGIQLNVINYGATITSLKIPLKNEKVVDVVLGFDSLQNYINSFDLDGAPYLGATIGRYAGRINNSVFSLNEKKINLNRNNNNHSLHGGNDNFSKKIWKVENVKNGINPSITLSYLSPNNEENYPGELSVKLTYTLSEENELIIEYFATTTRDTPVNLTHHSYFNLDGHNCNIIEQELTVNAKKMLETTNENIPTGRFLDLVNTPNDFSESKKCPSKIDNTFVLEKENEFAGSLFSKNNNLKMEVYTNQPGVHIYVGGNCSKTVKGKQNVEYHSLSGICFETQNFPDAPNHTHFPSSILKKGEIYHHKTIYKFQSF